MTEAESNPARLQVSDLNLWRGESWLVRKLSFEATAGELLHVAGPNGSGKTTLLRALCGLTRPETGHISWCNRPLDADLLAYHRHLSWLGHRDGLKPELTPVENLQAYSRLSHAATDEVIVETLNKAGVGDITHLPTRVLSAGQRRRVALARVMCAQTRLWILDEPFANLDYAGQQWGVRLLDEHVAAGGIVIVTTHQQLDTRRLKLIELGT